MQSKEDNFDTKNINEEWKDQDSDKMKENTLLLRRNSVQNLFNGYYYDSTIAAIAGAKLSQIVPESNNKTEGMYINVLSIPYLEITKNGTKGVDTTEIVSQPNRDFGHEGLPIEC